MVVTQEVADQPRVVPGLFMSPEDAGLDITYDEGANLSTVRFEAPAGDSGSVASLTIVFKGKVSCFDESVYAAEAVLPEIMRQMVQSAERVAEANFDSAWTRHSIPVVANGIDPELVQPEDHKKPYDFSVVQDEGNKITTATFNVPERRIGSPVKSISIEFKGEVTVPKTGGLLLGAMQTMVNSAEVHHKTEFKCTI